MAYIYILHIILYNYYMILYNVYNDIENRYEWDMSHDIFNGNQWDIQQSKIKTVHPKWEYVERADDQPLDICMKISQNDGQFIRIPISQIIASGNLT